MTTLEHPYPRYGLAVALLEAGLLEAPESTPKLLQIIARSLSLALSKVRVHTKDKLNPAEECLLRYYYVPKEALNEGKQDAKNFFYLAPYVATSDKAVGDLIGNINGMIEALAKGNAEIKTKLQRSFSPFTAKLNQGNASLREPETNLITAALIALATVTAWKPAMQVEFKNQVMIPDISLYGMRLFADLFRQMQSECEGLLIAKVLPKSKYYRPKIHRGNFPNAPSSPLFGPISLLAAMATWAKEAGRLNDFKAVLQEIVEQNTIYLVSYEGSLMRQEKIGSHVERIAIEYNLSSIIEGLSQALLYNEDDNKPDNPKRLLFFMMAGRFLQLYTAPAFEDFLAFRGQYHANFSPILEDYFMNEQHVAQDLVQSARAYGAHLNRVAYNSAKEEIKEAKTNRNIYTAKSRYLAELESAVMNAKHVSDIFAVVNVRAGRMSESDVPPEAYPFIEAALVGELSKKITQNMVLAFMRLRNPYEGKGDENTSKEKTTSLQTEVSKKYEDE